MVTELNKTQPEEKEIKTMLNTKFGIEIEFTGITRAEAARTAAEFLGGTYRHAGTYYDIYEVTDHKNRKWKFMSDGSIKCQKKVNGVKVNADRAYSVELVSPILTYNEDIETLQELVRRIRKAGAFTNESVGIHIHLNGADHSVRSIKNFINMISLNCVKIKKMKIII